MSVHDKNSLSYWSGICPDYKTVEQFEMFIESRKKDIEMINESILDAQEKLCKLEGKDCYDKSFKSLAKKFLKILRYGNNEIMDTN